LIGTQEKEKIRTNKKITRRNRRQHGRQKILGTVAVIFSGVPGSRSKYQDKLALRSIMAAQPAVPRYLNWSKYPI
jgi:hypothetical protein